MTEAKKKLLIVQEAMGGCGRNVVDIAPASTTAGST